MKTVAEILALKGKDVWTASADTTVFDALLIMASKGIGALLVKEGDELVGISSERDFARGMVEPGHSPADFRVRDLMTKRVVYAEPRHTVDECMALMTDKRIRHLPIMDQGELIGIISIGDVVKAVIEEKQFLISQLENYITGR